MPSDRRKKRVFLIRAAGEIHRIPAPAREQAAHQFVRRYRPGILSRAVQLMDGTWHGVKGGFHLKEVPPFKVELAPEEEV